MKGLKKLGSLFLVAIFLLVGIANVKAYNINDIAVDNKGITLNFLDPDDAEFGEYISISTNGRDIYDYIKDEKAKVSLQYVKVEKSVFDDINTKYDACDTLPDGTEKDNACEAYINSVPDPVVAGTWKEIALTKTTADVNYYGVAVDDNAPDYFVAWVKVEVEGKETVYGYNVKCLAKVPRTCDYYNGKWYNKAGKQVTEAEYIKDCLYCEPYGDKYINSKYEIVDEAAYKKDCFPNCKVKDGKYYDNDGNEITKSQYDKLCGNPKTGNQTFYMYGIATVGIAFVLYMFTRKIRKFSK